MCLFTGRNMFTITVDNDNKITYFVSIYTVVDTSSRPRPMEN